MTRRSGHLLLGNREVQAALAGHATILFELLETALVLWMKRKPAAHVVIHDHEVIARKIAMEYRHARGAEAAAHALRFAVCYLISLCVYLRADRIVALTAEDHEWLMRCFPSMGNRVRLVPVPFVDEHPSQPTVPTRIPVRDLLMVANFFHSPNVDAIRWFLRECAPHLDPGFTLHLCGFDKPLDEVDLSGNIAVVRHGFVADVMTAAPDATIAVAPVVSGGGVRIKNLLLASMRKVVVTTPLGNEGIGFVDGRDAIITGSGREMASRINAIARSTDDQRRLGEGGRACVLEKFGSASAVDRLVREALTHDDDRCAA